MDKEVKKFLAVINITIAIFIVIFLLLLGFDLSGSKVHTGIKVK